MADLELTLSWLDMPQYYEHFIQAGFDSWETILEITEEDLETLDVELGHRRKLQREIANTRRLSQDPGFVTPLYHIPNEGRSTQSRSRSTFTRVDNLTGAPGKRGYRHHPKQDGDAPERPYSAYVLFSNQLREDLKDQSLTFTELSKSVGDRWQSMGPEEKEYWKHKAAIPWDKYKANVAEYQKTDSYKKYTEYLKGFKATQKAKRQADAQSKTSSTSSVQGPTRQKTSSSSRESYHRSSVKSLSSATSMAPPSAHHGDVEPDESKSPIGRVRKEIYTRGPGVHSLRVAQACEPCRQRKTKCHGDRPTCRHCAEISIECYYVDGTRDKDKRLIENLWKKVNAQEELLLRIVHQVGSADQAAIQQCLLMPPQLEDFSSPASPAPLDGVRESVSNANSDYGGGESVASGVGSMGSTDHANEEDFTQGESEIKKKAFVGQTSEIRWMQRLERELTSPPTPVFDRDAKKHLDLPVLSRNKASRETLPSAILTTNPNPYPADMDTSMLGDRLNPFDVPVKPTADRLIDIFFNTVHPSFPLIDKADFMAQYEQFFANQDLANFQDRTFVATLQIIFAIAAVHAHLVEAEWAGDERDHLLYFAKGRMLGVDTGVLNDMAYLGQVLVFALAGMYLIVTDQVNRAWNTIGVAIRCAQSLGMHLINTTPTLTDQQKAHRARVWCSIVTLERSLTIMTGRPSMVRNRDCSVILPLLMAEEGSLRDIENLHQTHLVSSSDYGSRALGSPSSPPIQRAVDSKSFASSKTARADAYFHHYVTLNALAQQAMARLYSPEIRRLKWSEIQRRIEELDAKLVQWNAALPAPFSLETPSQDSQAESYRVALGILSHSTRTVINRPCLCRLDRRMADQSRHSNRADHASANKCVSSARSVIGLVSDRPHNAVLHQGTLWWMTVHHLKRAVTVVLLELAFRAEHMPSEAEDILSEAKGAINWLRGMAVFDAGAHRSWISLSRLLRLAAQKVGGDASEVVMAASSHFGETRPIDEFIQHVPPAPSDQYDPHVWQPLDNYYTSHFFADQAASEYDQYGFLQENAAQPSGAQNLWHSPAAQGGRRGQQGHENEDEVMWPGGQDPSVGEWYGQFGAS